MPKVNYAFPQPICMPHMKAQQMAVSYRDTAQSQTWANSSENATNSDRDIWTQLGKSATQQLPRAISP